MNTICTIRERLSRNELVVLMAIGRLMHHTLIQVVGLQKGIHGVWFDLEHTGFSIETLEVATLAARSVGLDCLVRIPPSNYATITQCLEAGGGGILAAQIQSAQHAEQIVQWTKFHPRGNRGMNRSGWDGRFTALDTAEFCERSNRESFVAIQIETVGAVEECEAIAAIDGVDLLFIGPSDLSQSLGVPGEFFHPICLSAIDRVAAACRRAGKHWGAACVGPDYVEMVLEKGCTVITPCSDSSLIVAGIQSIKQKYAMLFDPEHGRRASIASAPHIHVGTQRTLSDSNGNRNLRVDGVDSKR
jgi:4-hydroxy-2-oxoheptanedioate aldolase